MSKANLAPDLVCKQYSVYAEIDLMERVRDMVSRKVEADGEMALECALAEVGFVRERTCEDAGTRFNAWVCSECDATLLLMFDDYDEPTYSVNGVADVPRYCPNCGAKVVER